VSEKTKIFAVSPGVSVGEELSGSAAANTAENLFSIQSPTRRLSAMKVRIKPRRERNNLSITIY
jgi:hypothetical protein